MQSVNCSLHRLNSNHLHYVVNYAKWEVTQMALRKHRGDVSRYGELDGRAKVLVMQIKSNFEELGKVLRDIRTSRAYLAKYPSFDEYCEKELGFGRVRAHQLENGAAFAARMISDGKPKPQSESAIRPILTLPEEEQADAYQEAGEETARARGADGWVQPTSKYSLAAVTRRKGSHGHGMRSPVIPMGQRPPEMRVNEFGDVISDEDGFDGFAEDVPSRNVQEALKPICQTCDGDGKCPSCGGTGEVDGG